MKDYFIRIKDQNLGGILQICSESDEEALQGVRGIIEKNEEFRNKFNITLPFELEFVDEKEALKTNKKFCNT